MQCLVVFGRFPSLTSETVLSGICHHTPPPHHHDHHPPNDLGIRVRCPNVVVGGHRRAVRCDAGRPILNNAGTLPSPSSLDAQKGSRKTLNRKKIHVGVGGKARLKGLTMANHASHGPSCTFFFLFPSNLAAYLIPRCDGRPGLCRLADLT
ncbi:unnamed protein product [Periconia digitata]|uniref:Uncharacterized protein n=1 Tax=Periconia digitata TaxID=1303443 RepID=A0A9W4UKB1_9PLEO|nr:unnamed protein product [Periconia digitata]